MNNVILIGNLVRDPELRYSTGQNQTAVCRFTVAVNDGYGERQRTSFIPIVVFGKQAENCERYLAKGRKVAVNGRIQTGSYEKDGRTVYTTDVIANNVEFLSSSQQGGNPGGYSNQGSLNQVGGDPFNQAPFGGGSAQPAGGMDDDLPNGFNAINDDDIPF